MPVDGQLLFEHVGHFDDHSISNLGSQRLERLPIHHDHLERQRYVFQLWGQLDT